jgi:tRNA-splicing ligase RtcB
MGEISVILEGLDTPESKLALRSTVHGAGRVLGRKMATGVYDRKTGVCKREGLVKPEMMAGWLERGNVVLRGGGLDESPDCYKRLPQVLAAHGETIRVLHTLTPLGVAMAGANEFDPYKD